MTWDDVEKRSLHCPVVQMMLEMIRRGMGREEALIRAVLWLSEDRQGQIRERTRLMRQNPLQNFMR